MIPEGAPKRKHKVRKLKVRKTKVKPPKVRVYITARVGVLHLAERLSPASLIDSYILLN